MLSLLLLVGVNTATWVANSVFFWQITLAGGAFSAYFLLWFTDIPYFVFLPLLYKFPGPPTLHAHAIYILYSVFATVDALFEMVAAPRVSGMMQTILSAAIPLPTVGILAFLVLKQKFGKWHVLGALLVLVASAVQMTSSIGTGGGISSQQPVENKPLWAFLFAVGLIMGSIVSIIWEVGLTWYGVTPVALMLWSTVYTIPLYAGSVVVHGLLWGWDDQVSGLTCFFGTATNITVPSCTKTAWIAVTGYGVTSVASDYVQIYLVSLDSAFFLLIADAIATPLLAIIFALPVFGKDTEPFTWQSVVSTALVVLGMLVYKKTEIQLWWQQRKQSKEDQSLLDAAAAADTASMASEEE